MDDGTSVPKRCAVCGDPISPRNSYGICADPKKRACLSARNRIQREERAKPKPEPRHCEVCGCELGFNNHMGICSGIGKPACRKARERRSRGLPEPARCEVCGREVSGNNTTGICISADPAHALARTQKVRQAKGAAHSGRRHCSHPDGCPNDSYIKGLCVMHHARFEKTGELGPVGSLFRPIAISLGDTFGRWTALEDYGTDNKRVLCRCECGTEKRILGARLANGQSQNCGCMSTWPKPVRAKDPYLRADAVFGRLTLLEDVAYSSDRAHCRCECGTEKRIAATHLKFGKTRSCGCLKRDLQTTHGLTGHALYSTWYGIISRTCDPSSDAYPDYGGRGISVCEQWKDVAVFIEDIERELGPRPGRAFSLDRIDVDGNYEIGNLQWADKATQSRNRRTVGRLTRERDALAAEVERLTQLLASRSLDAAPVT